VPHISTNFIHFDVQFQKIFELHQFSIDQAQFGKSILNEEQIQVSQIRLKQKNKNFMIEKEDSGEQDDNERERERLIDHENRLSLYNEKIPLDEYLLYMIFNKSKNKGIRDMAIEVLVHNLGQRQALL